jgi:steroid delta-isomerase-like uncharacterized protein
MMSQENKTIVRNYIEQVWNAHRPDRLDQFIAKDVVHHDAPGVTDFDSIKQFVATTLAAFPDYKATIDDEIAEGDRVVQHQTYSVTQKGELLGMPATGKHAVIPGVFIFRVSGGKIAEMWGVADTMSMMQQLGLMPAPAPGAS